jgi:hypothetical protein
MINNWNSFIKESSSYEDLLENVKFAFVELLEDNIVTIYIENNIKESITLQTNFKPTTGRITSNDFFEYYDKHNEYIKDIQTAISRLENDKIACHMNFQNIGLNFEMTFTSNDIEVGTFYTKRGNVISIIASKLKDGLFITKERQKSVGFELYGPLWEKSLKIHFSHKDEINRTYFPYIINQELSHIFYKLKIDNDPFIISLKKVSNKDYPYYIMVELNPKYTYQIIED